MVRQLLDDGMAPQEIRAHLKLSGFAKARISQLMKGAGCASTDAERASSRGSRGTASQLTDFDIGTHDNDAAMDVDAAYADRRPETTLAQGSSGFEGWLRQMQTFIFRVWEVVARVTHTIFLYCHEDAKQMQVMRLPVATTRPRWRTLKLQKTENEKLQAVNKELATSTR